MFPLIETAVAFVVIMLAASLMVTALVRLIHSVTRRRGAGVTDMLVRLHHGFRTRQGIYSSPGDDAEQAFVHDILCDPLLHTSTRLRKNKAWNASALVHDPTHGHEDRGEAIRQFASSIDYLSKDDLIDLVRSHAEEADDGTKVLPSRWCPGLKPEDARVESFVKHIGRWFDTVEGTVAQEFGEQARRLAVILSCLLVVAVNLDGFRLAWSLYKDRTLRGRIASQVGEVQRSADRLGVEPGKADRTGFAGGDVDRAETKLELQLNAAVLTEDDLPIGWQNSYIVRRWCAYQGCTTAGPAIQAPTKKELFFDVLMWLAGLAFSCMLLSQGAPFWVRVLGVVLNLRNAVQARKESESERNWEKEKLKLAASGGQELEDGDRPTGKPGGELEPGNG